MKQVELNVPIPLLEDLGVLSERFFENNESLDVLQSFAVRPQVLVLIIRVHRRGPFKDLDTIQREARALVRRYRLVRFEMLSANRERGEYIAWIEWKVPEPLREQLATGGGVFPLRVSRSGGREARVSLLVSEAVLPRLREVLRRYGGAGWVRSVRTAPADAWEPLARLTSRQRELLVLAFRLGYYESPAKISLDRLGGLVGVSKAALSKHLRVAERKVLMATLGGAR